MSIKKISVLYSIEMMSDDTAIINGKINSYTKRILAS
jgi:hypothetical protein